MVSIINSFLSLEALFDSEKFHKATLEARLENPFFTPEMVHNATNSIRQQMLSRSLLQAWIDGYQLAPERLRIGIVMAGNLPMVGFHDLLCALIAGHQVVVKLSSKDPILMKLLINQLESQDCPVEIIREMEGQKIDRLLVMGGNSAADYFRGQFVGIPMLIRANRWSVAVLSGDESDQDIASLGRDIFQYWGMGCRNVSRIYLPYGYDVESLSQKLNQHKPEQCKAFDDCYRYARAMALMQGHEIMDGGWFIMRQGDFTPRIAEISYQFYKSIDDLVFDESQLQCVVSSIPDLKFTRVVPFGVAQSPSLTDYPDGLDVLNFLGMVAK